ncbi:hypothetical protein CLAFUR0_03916 [Fulvia fulva]|nr:hypothetical protein CLAFUR0_03916 [Fulvia fulva]
MASQHNPPHASAQTSPATSLPMQKSSVTAVPKPAGLKEVLKKTKQPASRRRKLPSNFPITETTPEDRATSRNANVMASQSTITTAQSVLSDEEAGSSVEDLIASAQQYMAAPINEEAHGSVRPGEQPARAEGSKKRKASAKLSKDESAAKKRKPATKTASVKNACASSCSNAKLPVYRPYISDDEDDSEPEHPTFTHRCTRRDPGSLGRTFTVITRGTASHKHIEETILHTSKVREECCWLYRKVKGAGGDLKLMELDSDAFRIWWEEWLYAGKVVFDLGPEVGEDGFVSPLAGH